MNHARAAPKANMPEREARMDEAAEIWSKQIVPAWHSKSLSVQKKVKELVLRVGVPPRVRGVVWPLALSNALMVTQELYEIFGQQAARARKMRVEELKALNHVQNGDVVGAAAMAAAASAAASTPGDMASPSASPSSSSALPSSPCWSFGKQSTFSYIDVDLTRTYPSLAFFQEECPMNAQLRHLLYAYVRSTSAQNLLHKWQPTSVREPTASLICSFFTLFCYAAISSFSLSSLSLSLL